MFCNNREREAIREAKSLFDQYGPAIEKIESTEADADGQIEDENLEQGQEHSENSDNESDVDIDAALENEKKQLDEEAKQKVASGEKFQLLQTGVQNVLFFKSRLKSPLRLVLAVIKDIELSGSQKTRFLLRLVPVDATCKAFEENVKDTCGKILPKYFNQESSPSYSILFKSRLNQSFAKEDAYKLIGGLIREMSPRSKVEFKAPDVVIVIEVMKGNCCIGVLPDYYKHKKYNLVELGKETGTVDKSGAD